MAWVVKLVKTPRVNGFRHGFFPRKVHYKKDAMELRAEVERKGGQAVVEKVAR